MMESPLIQELVAEHMHNAIAKVLESRFGSMPPDIKTRLQRVQETAKLYDLNSLAATCRDLDEFRKRLENDTGS